MQRRYYGGVTEVLRRCNGGISEAFQGGWAVVTREDGLVWTHSGSGDALKAFEFTNECPLSVNRYRNTLYQGLMHASFPKVKTSAAQTCERNRSHVEMRCLIPFVSVAVSWMKKCPNSRRASLSGFFDAMSAKTVSRSLLPCNDPVLPKGFRDKAMELG